MLNPTNAAHALVLKNIEAAARNLKLKIFVVPARATSEIEKGFELIAREQAGAVMVLQDPVFTQQRAQLAALAAQYSLPSIFSYREYVEAGGLMSYGQSNPEQYRRAAGYVHRIFQGAKPAELPVERPTTAELFINARTARALGLAIPEELRVHATRIIE
jgi:putative ABC transport system substrate-binding protein